MVVIEKENLQLELQKISFQQGTRIESALRRKSNVSRKHHKSYQSDSLEK